MPYRINVAAGRVLRKTHEIFWGHPTVFEGRNKLVFGDDSRCHTTANHRLPVRSSRNAVFLLSCQAEITELGAEARVNKNITRLQVTMQHRWLGGMKEPQPLGKL